MKQGRKEQFQAHYMKTNILMPKPGKAIIRKSYKPIAFINIYGKILSNKNPATTKRLYTTIKWDLFQEFKVELIFKIQLI